MNAIVSAIQAFLSVGAAVMVPIFIILIGLILGLKLTDSARSGLTIGIGFVGVFAVLGILGNSVGPAAAKISQNLGISLTAVDMGWASMAAITWANPTAIAIIPVCMIINALMLASRTTKTLDLDIWNYWNSGFAGALLYVATGNVIIGIVGMAIYFILQLRLADWTAPLVQDPECFNYPGVSWPWFQMMQAPLGFFIDRVLKVIPGINKVKADPETIIKRLGFLGEGPVVGLILGILIGILARYDFGGILNLGVNLAAVMMLLPQMIGVMMQGLLPFSESVGEQLKKRGVKREIYIGIDGCISSGYMPLLASTMIIIAITPFLAVILPGNRTLPMADLAVAWSWGVWSVAPSKGNLFRGIINHILITIGALYLASLVAPFVTEAAKVSGVDLKGMTMITAITAGGMLWTVLFIIPALFFMGRPDIFGFNPATMMIFFVAFTAFYFIIWWVVRKDPRRIAATSLEDMRKGILNPDPLDKVVKARAK